MIGYVPHTERHGSQDAWASFEAAIERYFDAEMRVILAAQKMRRTAQRLGEATHD